MKNLATLAQGVMIIMLSQTAWSEGDDAWQHAEEYCRSLASSSPDEEVNAYFQECIAEQRAYLPDSDDAESRYEAGDDIANESDVGSDDDRAGSIDESAYDEMAEESEAQEPSYVYEADTVDCYQVADEQLQTMLDNNPDADIDYEQLLDRCLAKQE